MKKNSTRTLPKLVLTHSYFSKQTEDLTQGQAHTVTASTLTSLRRELRDADGVMIQFWEKVDTKFLNLAPQLRVLATFSVGLDHIDLHECHRRGIRVVHTPGVLTRATAEQAMSLLLACARRTVEGDRLCRKGRGWKPAPDFMLGQSLSGRRALIVGAGRIGKETARLMRAHGIQVEFSGRGDPSLPTRLGRTQILSLHLPLTPDTRHWLDSAKLRLLPHDAIVINTGRGALIDEKALVLALQRGQLFGAGLDVFEQEPTIPLALRKMGQVVLAPHLGSATLETRRAMARLAVQGALTILNHPSGRRPANEYKYCPKKIIQ